MEIVNPVKQYKTDNTMIYSCQYHIIFASKYRRKVLTAEIDARLKELVSEKQEEYGYRVIEMEVMPDHIHLLLDVHPKVSIVTIVNKIKGYTSNILRSEFPSLRSRIPALWTRSKFITTVGSVSLEVVKHYIENQKNV